MTDEKNVASRGRPPLTGQKMTKAEYQRRYRAKKAKQAKEVYFSLSAQDVEVLDKLAEFFGVESRSKLIADLLTGKIKEGLLFMEVFEEARGRCDDLDQLKAQMWESYRWSLHYKTMILEEMEKTK